MDIQKIHKYKSAFDAIEKEIKDDEGNAIEVWYARELQQVFQDFMLTRYACYLIAQNGDPKKEEVA